MQLMGVGAALILKQWMRFFANTEMEPWQITLSLLSFLVSALTLMLDRNKV